MVYQETIPRGPIAAAYNSPGPIYALPRLVGAQEHDPRSVYERKPAYSFGTRHGKFTDDASPGPIYNPDARFSRTGVDYSPRYSLYGRPRDLKSWAQSTPGPGAYTPQNSSPAVSPRGPSYSFGSRTNNRGRDNNPGPNEYYLPSLLGKTVDSTKKQAPCYTQIGRSNKGGFHEDMTKTPGPAYYPMTNPNVYKHKGPQYSQIGRSKVVGDNTMKPGPGAHNPENANSYKQAAPAYSFGVRHSQFQAPVLIDAED